MRTRSIYRYRSCQKKELPALAFAIAGGFPNDSHFFLAESGYATTVGAPVQILNILVYILILTVLSFLDF
jgi:hypothetical protein